MYSLSGRYSGWPCVDSEKKFVGIHFNEVDKGSAVIADITANHIFFKIIGPIFRKIRLERAGEIP